MAHISLIMTMHMLAGSVAVFSGTMSLLLKKGSWLHKLAGRLFVASIVLMGPVVAAGAWLAAGSISSLGVLFVFFIIYLVVSAWSTIQRSVPGLGRLDIVAPVAALCIVIAGMIMGYAALSRPSGAEGAPPNEAYFFFAALAFIAMLLDVNNIKSGGVRGQHRVVRHVWRMSVALFFATSSLFTGPGAVVFPESVRGHPLLLIPQTLVVLAAIFWIYRLLFSKQHRSTSTT